MHRPLEDNCTIHLKSCLDPEPQVLNQAFWRTCSFLLASVARRSFKDTVTVTPHSFPKPNGKFFALFSVGTSFKICFSLQL